MRTRGFRFGFVSTYETVFLKITIEKDIATLYYSDVIKHTTKADADQLQVSVRLGLLYLLKRVSHPDKDTWSFDPDLINATTWTETKPNDGVGAVAKFSVTPNRPYPAASARDPSLVKTPVVNAVDPGLAEYKVDDLMRALEEAKSENRTHITVRPFQYEGTQFYRVNLQDTLISESIDSKHTSTFVLARIFR